MTSGAGWPTILACGLLAASVGATPRSEAADSIRPEVLDTFLKMRIVAAALDTHRVTAPYPGPTDGVVPIAFIVEGISSGATAIRSAARDGWGHPLLYWSDGRDYLLLSLGSDGKAQFDYAADPPYARVPRAWVGSNPSDDLLIVDGIAYRGPATQSELLIRAMAEIRSMGTACESYAVDTNFYPGPVEPPDSVSRIESEVEPVYIRMLPRTDPWGRPYLFWSDTQGYAFVSYGADGLPEFPYSTWGRAEFESLDTGPTFDAGRDIVFVKGRFTQWPAIGNGP